MVQPGTYVIETVWVRSDQVEAFLKAYPDSVLLSDSEVDGRKQVGISAKPAVVQ
jgi:hypothetical protein